MKGEKILTILIPKLEDDWVLVQTDQALYSLRLGGFKRVKPIESVDNYEIMPCPFKDRKIQNIYSDDEWVYYIVDGDGIIESGWTKVGLSGEMELGVKFSTLEDYGNKFFDSDDFFQLITDSNGESEKA